LGDSFPVLQTIGEDAESKHLDFGNGVLPVPAIRQRSRESLEFCDPAPIIFLLQFNGETRQRHAAIISHPHVCCHLIGRVEFP